MDVIVQQNTFQLVITSDGRRHVAIFHYDSIEELGAVNKIPSLQCVSVQTFVTFSTADNEVNINTNISVFFSCDHVLYRMTLSVVSFIVV